MGVMPGVAVVRIAQNWSPPASSASSRSAVLVTNTSGRSNSLILRFAAERTRGSLAGAIFDSDHGAQYTSKDFAAAREAVRARQSMSTVGGSADNALDESFSASFKRETLRGRRAFADERDARLTSFR
ncbi:MAG TPA: hypothetical protein VGD29_15850 [Actinoplanes sp.]|jgi:transposase InsO family protein